MATARRPCRHFSNPGGCRFGANCRFAHGDAQTGSQGRSNAVVSPPRTSPGVPFSVRAMRDKLMQQLTSDLVRERGYSDPLTALWDPATNKQDTRWKRFLLPETSANPRELATQMDVLIFVNSALHALIKSPVIAPQFIRAMGQKDGMGAEIIRRFAERLEFSESAGRQRELVSFQRGLVPFFMMLTTQFMVTSAQLNVGGANYIYSCVFDHRGALINKYLEKLAQVVDSGSFEDPLLKHERFLDEQEGTWFAPLCVSQLVFPFLTVLDALATKFPEVAFEPLFQRTVHKVRELVDKWRGEHDEAELDSALCYELMDDLFKRLDMIVNLSLRSNRFGDALKASQARARQTTDTVDPVEQQWNLVPVVPPGQHLLHDGALGPRHDNDFVDISQIRILPTSEEIFSPYEPALPGNFTFLEGAHWLPPGPDRWIDTHFRLFREDMCRILRESLQDLLALFRDPGNTLRAGRMKGEKVDFTLYTIQSLVLRMYHTSSKEREGGGRRIRRGMCVDLLFPHSTLGVNVEKADLTRFWGHTGRLRLFSMVCLASFDGLKMAVVFCQVVIRDMDQLLNDPARISVQPYDSKDFKQLIRWQQSRAQVSLLEVNKLFFDSYEPVLKALQNVTTAEMPFVEYLAPAARLTEHDDGGIGRGEAAREMEAPLYCVQRNLDLSPCFTNGRSGWNVELNPRDPNSRRRCVESLVEFSTLERDQAEAVVGALSSRVACIQGLPGSGKSFIGNLITQVILKANVYPILVVCYTNHALDQFLCHLLDSDITKIVRIGGQSKEARLEPYNLSKLDKPYHAREVAILYQKLNAVAVELEDAAAAMASGAVSWRRLRRFLQDNYDKCYEAFARMSDSLFDGDWQVAGYEDVFEYWMGGADGASTNKTSKTNLTSAGWQCKLLEGSVWAWTMHERKRAYDIWRDEIAEGLMDEFIDAQTRYMESLAEMSGVRDRAEIGILQRAQVIGMTTTGVAKHRHKIAAVSPKALICEEAGEVLEAQLMACLTQSCQQLILIGDHQQLRPHIAVYDLSVESKRGQQYRLDVSMFERLVSTTNGRRDAPLWALTQQHRMRPEISQFVRTLFYPGLRNAEETETYPSVKGVDKNVFFVSHIYPEDGAAAREKQQQLATSVRSHSNAFEVNYIIGLLRYLMRQGYQSSDIAIITPYVSQLLAIREVLRREFIIQLGELDQAEMEQELADEELIQQLGAQRSASLGVATQTQLSDVIRLATVDNFQGEEANIILVSLVRSSVSKGEDVRGTIGFLKTPNRINVLMSRAKHGLYLVGHGALLRHKSSLWATILEKMVEDGCYGDGLPIHCQKHPDDHRVIKEVRDFQTLAPNGGCLRPCGLRLPKCGHVCRMLCHTDRASHATIYCLQPCLRLHDRCGHACSKPCGNDCGKCEVVVGTITLPCGHKYENAKCWEAKKPQKVVCKAQVDRLIDACGHVVKAPCEASSVTCSRVCGATLSCGHMCRRKCSICIGETLKGMVEDINSDVRAGVEFPIKATKHGACQKKCDRLLSCQHRCQSVCHIGSATDSVGASPCPPCTHKCEIFQCVHGKCEHPCHSVCSACCEDCSWSCEHTGACALPCGAPCLRQLCDKRCSKFLLCGHQCPSICGEVCPSSVFCHICASPATREKQVDLICFQSYGEVDPSEDPIVVLPCCRAMYTMSSLDGVVALSTVYDAEGFPRELPSGYMETIPQCPNCKKPIRGVNRYGRVTKRAAIDASERKFIETSQRTFVGLQRRFTALADMKASAGDGTDAGDVNNDAVHALSKTLVSNVKRFARSVKQPPCREVYNACVAKLTKDTAKRLGRSNGAGNLHDGDVRLLPVPNTKFPFVGNANLMLAQYYVLMQDASVAERYANVAVDHFDADSFTIQAREARLVLAQALVLKADQLLHDKSATDTKKAAQETHKVARLVEAIAGKITELLELLPATFRSQRRDELATLTRRLDMVRKRAAGQAFYEPITNAELRNVRMAMQREFAGSGHWYRCPNGHSYTVGECGMPMEQTACPECRAIVGGADHMSAAGNVHDTAMERL